MLFKLLRKSLRIDQTEDYIDEEVKDIVDFDNLKNKNDNLTPIITPENQSSLNSGNQNINNEILTNKENLNSTQPSPLTWVKKDEKEEIKHIIQFSTKRRNKMNFRGKSGSRGRGA